jgi:hypothetical protein
MDMTTTPQSTHEAAISAKSERHKRTMANIHSVSPYGSRQCPKPSDAPNVGDKFIRLGTEYEVTKVWMGRGNIWWMNYDAQGCYGSMHVTQFISENTEKPR